MRAVTAFAWDDERSSLLRVTALAAVLGAAAAGAAYVLVHLIALITNLALRQQWGWELPPSSELDTGPLLAVAGALVVSLLAVWCPTIRGHGIPEAMEAVLARQSRIAPRTALAKPVSSAVAIGTGGPFGAEGPIIVTGGALGSLLGQVLPVTPAERKILLCSGAAAGMAATFGAPIAAVALALELLLFEFSLRALVPLIVATSIAGGLHAVLLESGPLFEMPEHEFFGVETLPAFALLGLACGLLAVLISQGLFLVEHAYRLLPLRPFWHPILGAVGFATIGLFVPGALGVGYDEIGDVLNGRLATTTVAVLLVAKLVAWWLALGSGTSGGTLAPILLVAGCFGTLFAQVVPEALPGAEPSASAFALVAMAATFGAATRTPFTSIVFLFELTRDYDAVLPLMGATVVAVLVTQLLLRESLMTEKLARRGMLVRHLYELDPTSITRVGDVMTTDVTTVEAQLSVTAAQEVVLGGGHHAYPVVDDDGRCVGVVARDDLLATDAAGDESVRSVADPVVVGIGPERSVRQALGTMLAEDVDHLPVVDDTGRLVGICTRTDVLRAKAPQFDQDTRDRGWLRGLR